MGFFKEFHVHNCFVKSLNVMFQVLIPKKGGAEDLRDFGQLVWWVGCTSGWLKC